MSCELRPFADEKGRCARCGKDLPARRTVWCSGECYDRDFEQHLWALAKRLALKRDCHKCVKCGAEAGFFGLEVNHIVPRNGQGYLTGCWNHVSGLETLCRTHHVEVTKAQMAARTAAQIPAAVSSSSVIESGSTPTRDQK